MAPQRTLRWGPRVEIPGNAAGDPTGGQTPQGPAARLPSPGGLLRANGAGRADARCGVHGVLGPQAQGCQLTAATLSIRPWQALHSPPSPGSPPAGSHLGKGPRLGFEERRKKIQERGHCTTCIQGREAHATAFSGWNPGWLGWGKMGPQEGAQVSKKEGV